MADRKRGFEGVLWYQGMSRVCPECPQTNPREEREASWIRDAYGEHMGAKAEGRMKKAGNAGEATQSQVRVAT